MQRKFKVGDKVRMISENPRYGNGGIKIGEIGIVRSLGHVDDITVDFNAFEYWRGVDSEFELVTTEDKKTLQIPVKFQSGDKVYTIEPKKIEEICGICEGTGKIDYNNKAMKCPQCMGAGKSRTDKSKYVVCEDVYTVSSMKISVNKEKVTSIKYKCDCRIKTFNRTEENLFHTKEEAQTKCDELNKERIFINVDDIIIKDSFKSIIPSPDKLKNKLEYYKANGKFENEIIINKENVLQDGYINYLIYKMLGVDKVRVVVESEKAMKIDYTKGTKMFLRRTV